MCRLQYITVDYCEVNGLDLLHNEFDFSNVAFHGTCELYHENIIENGLKRGGVPFPNKEGELMVKILRQLGMPPVIKNKRSPLIGIIDYLNNRGNAALDFTFTGYEALYYATNARKGGQIFMAVRDAFKWLDENHNENVIINRLNNLRHLLARVEKSDGIVYAVRFSDELLANCKMGVAFNDLAGGFKCLKSYNKNISPEKIVAQINVDNGYPPSLENILLAKSSSNKKLQTRGTMAFNINPLSK